MKPCKVTVNGKKYVVDQHSVVKIQVYQDTEAVLDYCDKEESEMVIKEVKRIRHNRARQAIHQAYLDCGMVRVKGSLGGVYYE
jgi:hypothetical protein